MSVFELTSEQKTAFRGIVDAIGPGDLVLNIKDFGATGDGVTVDTVAIQNAVTASTGRTLLFPSGTYLTDRIIPNAGTTIILEPGVEIIAIANGTRCFQIQQPDVHVIGYGAKTTMDGSQSSHNIAFFQGAVRCSVRGLWADGSGGTGDDCFYIGGDPENDNVPKQISIIDCKGTNPGRNVVSVVACHGCVIEGGDFSGAVTDPPRAGIDVEANRFMSNGESAVLQCVIRRNRVYGNSNAGIVIIFGSDVLIEDNDVFGNFAGGIAVGAGGEQFSDDVYRPGDRLGISEFDSDGGWITVTSGTSGTDKLTDDLDIVPGMWLVRQTATGASWPSNVTMTRYQVVEIDDTQSKIRIGLAIGNGEVTTFSSSHSGALSLVAENSDLGFAVYGRIGNCDNIVIRKNFVHDNLGGLAQINATTCARTTIADNFVRGSTTGITSNYSFHVEIIGNYVNGVGVLTSARGINASTANFLRTDGNRISNFPLQGIVSSGSFSVSLGRDFVTNCGYNNSRAVDVSDCNFGEIRSVCFNDLSKASAHGIYINNCKLVIANSAVAFSSGADNASSLISVGANSGTNRFVNCVQYDGTLRT